MSHKVEQIHTHTCDNCGVHTTTETPKPPSHWMQIAVRPNDYCPLYSKDICGLCVQHLERIFPVFVRNARGCA